MAVDAIGIYESEGWIPWKTPNPTNVGTLDALRYSNVLNGLSGIGIASGQMVQ